MADDEALYTLVQKSQPLTNGVFEVTVHPLDDPHETYSYTVHTNLATMFYDLGGGRALIMTTELKGADRTYKHLLLDLATGEVKDTGFVLRTVTEDPEHLNTLYIQFHGCTENGVGIFGVHGSLSYGDSALYTVQLFETE